MHTKILLFIIVLMPALAISSPHTLFAASISKSLQISKAIDLNMGAQSVMSIMLARDVPSIISKKDLRGVEFKGKEKTLFALAERLNSVNGNLHLTLLELVRSGDKKAMSELSVLDTALRDNSALRRELLIDYVDHISQPTVALGGLVELGGEELNSANVLFHAYGDAFTQAIRRDNLEVAKKLASLEAHIYVEIISHAQSEAAIDYLSTVIDLYDINSLYGAFAMPKRSDHLFVYYLSKLEAKDLHEILHKNVEGFTGRTFIEDLYQLFTDYHAGTMIGDLVPAAAFEHTIDTVLSRIMLAKKTAGASVRGE